MKRRNFFSALLLLGGTIMRAPRVHALSAFAGALEPTQLANMIQLIEHTVHFIQMVVRLKQQVQYWQQNLKGFAKGDFGQAMTILNGTASLVSEFRGLTFAARSNIETFKKDHPGQTAPADGDYKQAYRDLDKQTVQAVERSLNSMNVQLTDEKGGLKKQHEVVQQLANQIDSADGQVKAAQLTNKLLVQLIQLAEKQILIMAGHAQQMGMYIANETQRRSYEQSVHQKLYQYRPPTAQPIDWSKQGLKGI
jgi:P-type conjugative transfer protein TrbJ